MTYLYASIESSAFAHFQYPIEIVLAVLEDCARHEMHLLPLQHIDQCELLLDCIEQIDYLFLLLLVVFESNHFLAAGSLVGLHLLQFQFSHGLRKLVELNLLLGKPLQCFALFGVDCVEVLNSREQLLPDWT